MSNVASLASARRRPKQKTQATRARELADRIKDDLRAAPDPIAKFCQVVRPTSIRRFRSEVITLLSDDYGYGVVEVMAYLGAAHDVFFSANAIKKLVAELNAGDDSADIHASATRLIDDGKVARFDFTATREPRVRPAKQAAAVREAPAAPVPESAAPAPAGLRVDVPSGDSALSDTLDLGSFDPVLTGITVSRAVLNAKSDGELKVTRKPTESDDDYRARVARTMKALTGSYEASREIRQQEEDDRARRSIAGGVPVPLPGSPE